MRSLNRFGGRLLLQAAAFSIVALLFYFPVGSVLKEAFTGESGFTLRHIFDIAGSPYYRRIIGFTFYQAVLSTLFAFLLGFPGAWLISTYEFPGKKLLRAVSAVPFVLPSILVVLGFVIFFGNNGYLNRILMKISGADTPPLKILYSMKAIILAHGFYNFPIILRIVSGLWEKLDRAPAVAAQSLGANRFRVFRTVTFPQLVPAILAAAALVFVFCFTSFAVILVLGGGPVHTTLEVEIYRQARISMDMTTASALSFTGIFISMIFVYVNIHFQNHHGTSSGTGSSHLYRSEPRNNRGSKFFFLFYTFLMLLIVAAPIISVIVKSFLKADFRGGTELFSLSSYSQLFNGEQTVFGSSTIRAVSNSLFLAFSSAAAAAITGLLISFSLKGKSLSVKILDTLFMLPVAVSSVIIGYSYMKVMDLFNLDISGSPFIILAHSVIAYPFVVRAVRPVLDKIHPELIYAAHSLGAGPFRVFLEIQIPIIKSSILTGAAFAFAISMGEMNATILLSSENTVTIPILIYRLIGSYNFTSACALGAILIIFTTLSFLMMDDFGSEAATGELK